MEDVSIGTMQFKGYKVFYRIEGEDKEMLLNYDNTMRFYPKTIDIFLKHFGYLSYHQAKSNVHWFKAMLESDECDEAWKNVMIKDIYIREFDIKIGHEITNNMVTIS